MKKLLLIICVLISFNLFAQPFSMIKEINTTATTGSIGSSLIQRVGSTVYFVANDGVSGNELWKSDGTSAGTVMVKDINPGSGSTSFINFTAGDGLLFFTANDGVNGFELWRTDGTSAGTFIVRDGFSECTFCLNRYFFHNGILYFAGDDGTTGAELWKTDGTIAGTVLVKDIFPGSTTSHPAPTSNVNYTFVAMGNDIYFSAVDAAGGRELFKSDGTEAGTVMIKDIYPGATSSISTVNHKAAVFNGKVYFAANDGPTGVELWATDGTEAGTYLVKDIVVGSGRSQPNNLIAFNGALYFTASSADNSLPDLWKTDGTEAGTVLVRNLVADGITLTIGSSSIIDFFTVANGKLFFRGNGPNGLELYASDGTTAGTGIVKDIYPGANSVHANGLFAYNNNVYFIGTDVELPSRSVLYKSDGTAAGTVQITDGASGGALGMSSATMTSAAGKLFFWGNTNDYGIELWSTDGTNANTAMVKDINTIKLGTPNSGANLFGTLVYNGFYYYAAVDDTHGNELWKSDGTEAGTVLVKDIWPGKAPSNPAQFFVFNSAIYFTASNGLSGTELWKTDGTESGTILVADINPGPVNSGPNRFFICNNFLYFTAYHPSYGIELWRSDGTAAGTTLVIDLVPGAATGTFGITDVISFGNNAYAIMSMVAGNVLGIPSGSRIIKIDGVTNTISDFASVVTTGTDLGVVGNTLYVTGRNSSNQTLLWKSENGSAVSQVKVLSTTSTNAYQLTNCAGKLYFSASNGTAAGQEPWISDGTDAGTFMLKDINPGANPSTPFQFVFSGGKVFFTASSTSTNFSEYELWATDGTTAGTYLVKDILPGSTGSRPNATISAFGNKVLFSANNGTNGYELWQSDGTATGTFQLQEFNTNGDGIPLTGVAFNFPTDFYQKLGDKIVFFARSADKGLQLYSGSIASPYKYVNDNSTANDVYTSAIGNNANNGSQSAPYATLTYALSQVSEGDTIYVDAGSYAEQVIINKGITIIGAGQTLSFFTPPASALIPAPGPFTEIGLFATTQGIGDVHISNLSINSNGNSQNIVIQSGGSVKNCTLLNGYQGIFFRVDPSIKTALIENNTIEPVGIGINCQGSGLTAIIRNNNISKPSGFFAGIFAGLDFGPLPQLTIQNNIVQNYFGIGLEVNSNNGNYNFNSFGGTNGAKDINRTSGNTPSATCNWFGSTDAGVVASKTSGTVNYTPFLTSGTDNSAAIGFQPVNAACSGRNAYYVNDNSLAGDVFTSAIGSNSNNGSASAPFATISYALTQAAPDDYIYVDAGTYTEQVTIDKGITIIGAGQNLTFITNSTQLVAPPGPFTEYALIQTTQGIGDVHISNLQTTNNPANDGHSILLQTGGSVKNCRIIDGSLGVFYRVESAAKTIEIENNFIQSSVFAVACQGSGSTVSVLNNTLNLTNPGFSVGIWVGIDFGPVAKLTATGNAINNYVYRGIVGNSNNTVLSENSILGTGQYAIENTAAPALATCNWYGSADVNVVALKITPGVTFSPWLVDGTDNSSAIGFQPLPNVCTGRQTRFYVNNNTSATRIFTTAAGSDANPGIPSAPFATISAAYQRAQTGDSLFIDAGTYSPGDGTIGKSITLVGTNYLTSPNDATNPLNANSSRVAETIISNLTWTIGANDIRVKGFTFDPQSKAALIQRNNTLDFDNVEISKNILLAGSTVAVVNLTGKHQSPLVTTNYVINDNRFVKESGGSGHNISINAIDAVQINNNVFTTNNTIVNNARIQNGISVGSLTGDIVISNNNAYQQNFFVLGNSAKKTTISFNTVDECNRLIFAGSSNVNPNEIEITDNVVTNPRSTVGPVISYSRFNGTNLSSPNIARIERNTITLNATGLTSIAQALIAPTVDNNSPNTQVYIRDNKLQISGDFSAQTNTGLYVSGIRFLNNSRQAVVENNDIEFTGINNGTVNKFGIGVLHSGLQPDATFDFTGNKISGFPTSIGIQSQATGNYGDLPFGLTMNINNNSFTGDIMSINNGTSGQGAIASCNWYGSASAQNFINKLSLSTVDIVPWLTNGTDNDAATGFQPVPNSCDGYPTLITLDNYTDVTCNGVNNGSINITTTYGKTPFTYTWTKDGDANFVSHDEDLTNLSPGTYHLSLVDGNGSNIYITDTEADGPGTIDVTITEPEVLSASAGGSNNLCFGETNGTASVLATGGTEPYTYLWSNGETTDEINNLAAGVYNVTVTDANGCIAQASYEVTQPSLLTASINNNSTACSNIATVVAAGGTTDYSYLWSNGATTATISSVPAGTYNVTVTDANGCTAQATIALTVSEAFNPSASVTDVSCFGGNTGVVTVTNANGTAPFTFSIDGINFVPGSLPYSFTGLAAGIYTVAVRDVNGCTGFVTKTITQPTQLTATLNSVQSTCYGLSTGSINITVSGGSPSYSYYWTGPNGYSSTQLNISGLAAGNYSLTVTDNKGCQSTLNVVVPSYNQIDVQSTVNNIACKGETTGSIILNVTGGTGNFNYLWNNGATTSSISNLSTGNYNVTVTDIGSGCVITRSYSISQPASAVNISVSKTNVTGCANLGTITATAGTSGTAPYSYSIDGINYQSSGSFTGLYAGSYTAWVKDANGCIKISAELNITDNGTDEFESNNSKNKSKTITIGTTNSARIALATDEADWFNFDTPAGGGNFTLNISHPTASFVINMYPAGNNAPALVPVGAATATTKEYSLAGNTTYYIQVTGGLSYICYQLSLSAPLIPQSSGSNLMQEINQQNLQKGIFDVKVFGNPSPTGFVLKVETDNNENMKLRVVDILGRVVETKQNLQPEQMIRFGEKFKAGVYFAEIIQGRNRKLLKLVKM